MNFRTRLAGAWSLLTGRGDDAVVCSFCGANRRTVARIIAGPGVTAICDRCVFTCQTVLRDRVNVDDGHRATNSIMLAHSEEGLTRIERAALENLLEQVVAALPACELVGWQYAHSAGQPDLLTFDIAAPADADIAALSRQANHHWKMLRDAALARSAPVETAATAAYDTLWSFTHTVKDAAGH